MDHQIKLKDCFFNPGLAVIGYSISVYNINSHYENLKRFYTHYVKDISKKSNEQINEHSGLVSFMNVTEHSSEFVDTPVNEKITTSEFSDQLFEDFYRYLITFVIYTCLTSSICHFAVAWALGRIEFVKFKIRKTQPVQESEMVLMNNAAVN
ncbi:hypothetical protein Avbf_09260 [Armadillidium vulgare]|nr:hypothetical protein Avbf_09260 [Armadillidium vulgare]